MKQKRFRKLMLASMHQLFAGSDVKFASRCGAKIMPNHKWLTGYEATSYQEAWDSFRSYGMSNFTDRCPVLKLER